MSVKNDGFGEAKSTGIPPHGSRNQTAGQLVDSSAG